MSVSQHTARDAADLVEWLRDTLGVELDEWQVRVVERSWATLRERQRATGQGGQAMDHRANDNDQFTAMNKTGETSGLPVAEGYPHRDAADQAPLVNPSAGTQGPAPAGAPFNQVGDGRG